MKKAISFLPLVLCLAAHATHAADLRIENPQMYSELRDTTFTPLFAALRAGDVRTIQRYLRGETYDQYRTLLERNTEYGQFLRNYYAGAQFELGEVVPAGNDYIANVSVYWPNGTTSLVRLQVGGTTTPGPRIGRQGLKPSDSGAVQWQVGRPIDNTAKRRDR